jgi:signal transduction histidine kinase/ActR/RegA family two-component response regulator
MENELRYLGDKIIKEKLTLAIKIAKIQGDEYTEILDNSGLPSRERMEFRVELIHHLGRALFDDRDFILVKVLECGKKAAELAVQYDISLGDSLKAMYSYRTVIWETIIKELQKSQFAAITMIEVSNIIDPLINEINGIFAETYEIQSSRMRLEKDEAEKANFAKTDFLSKMSHELRTPLNGILGFAQLLEMEHMEENQLGFVEEIVKSGNHLLNLINEILDLSRIESGHITLSTDVIDIYSVLDECINIVQPLSQQKNIKIQNISISWHEQLEYFYTQRLETYEKVWIKADSLRLKQVFINLLDNAIKYNHINGEITISCHFEDEAIVIHIVDTGQGMAKRELNQVFDSFYRVHGVMEEGTGIGLALVKQLVELMGGEIGVNSTLGFGSDFWIKFPIYQCQTHKLTLAGQCEKTFPSVKDQSNFQVLYIEDNESNLHLVKEILKAQNIELLTALNGRSGIDMANSKRVDLILLDLNLTDMSGYEVFELLRSTNLTANIPVIALSANAMDKDISYALETGFSNYVTKPLNVREFIATITMELDKLDLLVEVERFDR